MQHTRFCNLIFIFSCKHKNFQEKSLFKRCNSRNVCLLLEALERKKWKNIQARDFFREQSLKVFFFDDWTLVVEEFMIWIISLILFLALATVRFFSCNKIQLKIYFSIERDLFKKFQALLFSTYQKVFKLRINIQNGT